MARKRTIQDSVRSVYKGIHDNDSDKIYNSIPSEYKPRNYNEVSDGVFNIFRNDNDEKVFLKNLEKKFSMDMSKYSSEYKSELFKDIFKFGTYQRLTNTSDLVGDIPKDSPILRLINDHRSEIIFDNSIVTDLKSLNDAQKKSIQEKLLKPLQDLIPKKAWKQAKQTVQDAAFNLMPIPKLTEGIAPVLKAIADSPFVGTGDSALDYFKAQQENFKLNHVGVGNENAGVRYTQYEKSTPPTVYGEAAIEERKAAIKNLAPVFREVYLDLASQVMSPTQQTGEELLQKTVNNIISPVFIKRQTTEQALVRDLYRQKLAKDNMLVNGIMAFDYETIGNQIHEYAYIDSMVHIGKPGKDGEIVAEPLMRNKVSGLIGLRSEAEKSRIEKIISNLEKTGAIEDDPKYILQRLWAMGKAAEKGYIKQNKQTGAFTLEKFFDVNNANMQEIATIKKGYQTLVDIGEKQSKQSKVQVDYNGKQYNIAPFEKDLLMPLIKAVDRNQTVMAYNGINFDVTKLFKMVTQNDYISDDAKELFYASGLNNLKGYSNFFDPMIVARAGLVGEEIDDKEIRQAIMAQGQTYNTNTATYIRSGAKYGDIGTIHTGVADTWKMLVASIHSSFSRGPRENHRISKTFFEKLGLDDAKDSKEEITLGSVLSFNNSSAPFNANINGMMFTVDPINGQYRVAGNGTTISYATDGTPSFDEKSFGSYFAKDAPYVVSDIRKYTPKDIKALGQNIVSLDSSSLSEELYGVKLTRIATDKEGMAKTQPIHLIASKDSIETLLSTTATYHGDISAFYYGNNPNVIKISDITADEANQPEVAKYLSKISPKLQLESEKKARENIALKPLETWHNLNRRGKQGKESLADILSSAPDMQTAEADIIAKLQKDSSYFGFKINSINHLENIIGAYDTLKTYDDAGIFSAFKTAFNKKFSQGSFVDSSGKTRNVFDKGKMFAQFIENLKNGIGDLVQSAGSSDIKVPVSKEYKDNHFQFDLSPIAGKSRVHTAFDDSFSDATVTFDIGNENTLNAANRKVVSKLTKIFGLEDDKAGRNRALRMFGKALSNFYGYDYNVSDKADFEEALLNDIVLRMKEIRQETDYRNLPVQKKENIKDAVFAEVFSQLDNDTRDKLITQAAASTSDVKSLPKDGKQNVIKADILKSNNRYIAQNFGNTDITDHDKLLDFIANEIGEATDSNRIQNAAKEIEENLSNINEMTDFLLDKIVSSNGYDFIERPGEGYFISTGIGGEELNITNLLPSVKWNSELGRGQVYIGKVPVANMETAYIDRNGIIQYGREFDDIADKMALLPRMQYKGTMTAKEQLNYIASLLQEFNKNAREFSTIKKDNEDLQKASSFDFRDIYNRILDKFSDNGVLPEDKHKENPKHYRQFVAEQFNAAIDNLLAGELKNPEQLKRWAQSFADIKTWTGDMRESVPTSIANQQLYLRENMHDIFKVITSNGDLYSIFFGTKDPDSYTISKILDNFSNMYIGTRHAEQAIAYLGAEPLALENVGGPHKRYVNAAEKRNKTLDIEKHARYIESMRTIIGDENAEILKQASGYQSIFRGESESIGQEGKTYTGLILEMTHGNYKKLLESSAFRQHVESKGYQPKIVDMIIDDLNIYLGESSSIGSPYYANLNRPQSVQRIHASDIVPRNELRLMSDASEWQKAKEFKYRKELDFTLRLRDGNEKVFFTYGNLVHVNQGQNIITARRYPDSSQRQKAMSHGRVGMRYYKTIQGAQVEMSEEEINEILNTEENLTKIASAMKPNGRASQDNLTAVVDNILSGHGATRDYVLHEDFDNTTRKVLLNSQEKSMRTNMIASLGRYDQRIVKFFNSLGLGGTYLDRKVSSDFIDSIVTKTEFTSGREAIIKFNEESSLYQAVSRDKAFRESFIEYKQRTKEEREELKKQLKEAQAELRKLVGKRKLQSESLEDYLDKLSKHIELLKRSSAKKDKRIQKEYKLHYGKAQWHHKDKWQRLLEAGQITENIAEGHEIRYKAEAKRADDAYARLIEHRKKSQEKIEAAQKNFDAIKTVAQKQLLPKIQSIKERLAEIDSTSDIKYKDAVQIKLANELKKAFGSDATAETLQKAIRREQSIGWDTLTGFIGKIFNVDNANIRIAGLANTTVEAVKESHGEARGILTNIAGGAVTHYMHNEGMSREDAIVATRKYFNDNFLEDNSPKINTATGVVPEGLKVSTTKMQQHKDEIVKFLEGVAPDKNSTLLQEIFPDGSDGNMRLVSTEIQTMADPEGSRGHSLDKNKGFQYTTRVNTSLDYRRYNEEDVQNVFNFYKNRSKTEEELYNNIHKFNKLFENIAEGIFENGELKMNFRVDNLSAIKMFTNTIGVLNRAVDQSVKLDKDGLPIAYDAPRKITNIVKQATQNYNISMDRGYQIYAQQSVARAHSFNKKMADFYEVEENKALTGVHTQMQLVGDRQRAVVEDYAQNKNLEIVPINKVNTSKTAAPDDPYSIYQSDNFIIDMGEDSRMWLTDKNGNKQRYLMTAYTANELLDKETSQVVSTKMQDAIASMKNIYDSYITNGKDANRPEIAGAKMEKAMQTASEQYYDNTRMLAAGKNSIANTSTKVRLERSFNAKALVVDKLSTSDIVKHYGQEVADTSVYVGKDKAIELLGGEKHVKEFAEQYGYAYDDALGVMLNNMRNEGLLSVVKREPTNYAQSVSVTRVFYDANLAENQVGVGKVLAAFMKADSDGDLVSIAALTGKFTSSIRQEVKDENGQKHIDIIADHESFGTNIERNFVGNVDFANLQESWDAKAIDKEAKQNVELMAHSGTARMVSAKINAGYVDDATVNAGENVFKKWFGEIAQNGKETPGSLTRYAINGTMVNYDDVKAYSRLDVSARQNLDNVYRDYLDSDEYKKAAEAVFTAKEGQPQFDPNARLMAADQIAIANQYFKQVGIDNASEDLVTAIRVNTAKSVVSDKALADSMNGAAGINNTYTNRTRNLLDELMNKGLTNLTPHQSNILMNVMAEIDENGQAPKNHQVIEPAEIKEAIKDMWRMTNDYRGSWDWSTGEPQYIPPVNTNQAGDRFVDFMTSNFGNVSDMKNMKQVVIPEGVADKETWLRQELASAVNNLLPEGQRISKDYYDKAGAAYIQLSADTPVIYDTTNSTDPLKRSTVIAQDMAEQAGDSEVYTEPIAMTEEIKINRPKTKPPESEKPDYADYTREQHGKNFVEPNYASNAGTDTRSIIENFEETEGEAISTGTAIRRGAASIVHGIGKSLTSSKGILALAGSIMAAGFIGGAPTAPSGSEAQQTVQDAPQYQIEGSLVGDISPQINQRAPQGYVVNINASSSKGQDYISGLMQQTMRSQFPNQNISMSMNINDSSSNISFRDIANYMQGAI